MAADDVFDACSTLLDACSEALALAPGGSPARQFISAGLPAFDCEQLSVHVGGTTPGLVEGYTLPVEPPMVVGLRSTTTMKVNLLQLTVTIVRCTSVFNGKQSPSPAALTADARKTQADLWVIWNHLYTLRKNGLLFPPEHRELFFDPAVGLPIQGGMAGWEIPFRVQIDGYRTVT